MFAAYASGSDDKTEANASRPMFKSFPAAAGEESPAVTRPQPNSRNPFARNHISTIYKSDSRKNLAASKQSVRKAVKTSSKLSVKKVRSEKPCVFISAYSDVKELHFTDRKCDRSSIGLSSMYFADVPVYKRSFKLAKTVGATKRRNNRFNRQLRYHSKRAARLRRGAPLALVRWPDVGPEVLSLPFSRAPPKCEEDEGEGADETSLASRVQLLNMKVTHDAKDIASWIWLVEIQKELFGLSQSEATTRLTESALNKQLMCEKQVAILDKALQANPGHSDLRIRRLSILHHVLKPDQVRSEWKALLVAAPNNIDAWHSFVEFMMYNSKCDIDMVISVFATCFRYLIGMKNGTFVSHKLKENSERSIILLTLKLLYFLLKAGYAEKAVGLMYASISFNCFLSSDVMQLSYSNRVANLFEKSGGNLCFFDHQDQTAVSEKQMPEVEGFLRADLPVWKNWIALERARSTFQFMPVDRSQECEDAERQVQTDFIRQFLYPFDQHNIPDLVEQIGYFLMQDDDCTCLETVCSEEFFQVHLLNSNTQGNFSPDFSDVLCQLFSSICREPRFLNVYLRLVSTWGERKPSKRAFLKKSLKSVIQMPGNSNNLRVWRVLLLLESLDGNTKVVKKSVSAVIRMCESVSSNSVALNFKLNCALLLGGLKHMGGCADIEAVQPLLRDHATVEVSHFKLIENSSAEYMLWLLQRLTQQQTNYKDCLSMLEKLKDASRVELSLPLCLMVFRKWQLGFFSPRDAKEFFFEFLRRCDRIFGYQILASIYSSPYQKSCIRRFVDSRLYEDGRLSLFYANFLIETESIFRRKSILERSLFQHERNPYLWECYLTLCLQNLKQESTVLEIFQRCLENVAFDKNLYLAFVSYFPDQIQSLNRSMLDKKLRLRTPLEEVELYMQILSSSKQ